MCEGTALGYGALDESLNDAVMWHPAAFWYPRHKKKQCKREERERKLPVNGEEIDRKIAWNQPKGHLVWHFSAYTFT